LNETLSYHPRSVARNGERNRLDASMNDIIEAAKAADAHECGWEHHRDPTRSFRQDSNQIPDMQELAGSPHSGGMPCLFADGSVRNLNYAIDGTTVAQLWAWNDGKVLPSIDF
jgi:prepilin-type processing-associated H-X9-DG protein